MDNDFILIKHSFDTGINIYPLSDLHIGSKEFNKEVFEKWLQVVKNDPLAKVILLGDLINNGLKNSKTNVYEETMPPREQKKALVEYLTPIKDKIIGVVRGNHEERSVKEVDDCPMYDVCAKLDIEDLYRENAMFIKVSCGFKRKDRQWTYTLFGHHGANSNKMKQFVYALDGVDMSFSGHTHQPDSQFRSKIVLDPRNDCICFKPFTQIVCPSFLNYGGYGLRALYLPTSNINYPVVKLSGESKEVTTEWRCL